MKTEEEIFNVHTVKFSNRRAQIIESNSGKTMLRFKRLIAKDEDLLKKSAHSYKDRKIWVTDVGISRVALWALYQLLKKYFNE